MDGQAYLEIEALDHPPIVRVSRRGDIANEFWLKVMSEWGTGGVRPSLTIEVPRVQFLSNKNWVRAACRDYGVAVSTNSLAKELLGNGVRTSQDLAEARNNPGDVRSLTPLTGPGSRYAGQLRPFQERDVARLAQIAHGANFSVPGAGKTASTLALYELERIAGRVDRLLVVCPMSAFDSWIRESRLWLEPDPSVEIYKEAISHQTEILLINYQRIESSEQELTEWLISHQVHFVLDEAHRIKKGYEGLWGRLCLQLAYLAERRDVLTGTPAPQHPRDLIALTDFCWPGHGNSAIPGDSLIATPSPNAVRRAGEAISPLFVRTTKGELELPDLDIRTRPIAMTELQESIYNALRSRYVGEFTVDTHDRASLIQMGRVLMYLIEAATNPALLPAGSGPDDPISFRHPPLEIPEGSELAQLISNYGQYETPAKFAELARLVEENADQNKKTLVWSNFVRNLDYLANRFLTRLKPALIHGGIGYETTSGAGRNRVDELARFRDDPECLVLIANPAALGESISLHDSCHDAIYLDRTFNAGQYLQSLDRIHRLGLPPDAETNITLLQSIGTIDEVIAARVREKTERLELLMDDPNLTAMALPDEEEYGEPLDLADMQALFFHLSDDSS